MVKIEANENEVKYEIKKTKSDEIIFISSCLLGDLDAKTYFINF